MNELIKLAWRNLWRNKRRTLITTASIFFGVVLSAFMSSMQEGSYAMYIKTIVNFYSGYIQVHDSGYWDDKVINKTLEYTPVLRSKIKQVPGITATTPRLETYALASSAEITKGVMVIGIDPLKEDSITNLSKKITEGKFLAEGDSGVIMGSALAKYMKLNINDTIVLLGQGYHGMSAAGKYPVRGIIHQPSPQLDRTVVYMDIGNCQYLFSAPDMLTSVVIMVKNNDEVKSVVKSLTAKLGSAYEVMDWQEMNKILMVQIDSDRASGYIMKGILYLIIAFGILSTIMMMTLERRKEFGVLVSIGMQKSRLAGVLMLETIFIGLTGVAAGVIASIPLTWYFMLHPIPFTGQAAETSLQMGFEPIMAFSMMPSVYYVQAIAVLIFALLIGLYPVVKINRLNITKALRS